MDEAIISPTQIIAPTAANTYDTQEVEEPPEHIDPPEITWRQRAKRKTHCFLHDGSNPHCPGCQAKSRDKRHYKGSFDVHRATHSTSVIITMDQVTLADNEGQVGIGDVKYAIVISKLRHEALDHDYWTFLPLRSLESWSHYWPSILKAGRCTHAAPVGMDEEEFDNIADRFRDPSAVSYTHLTLPTKA